MARGRTAETPAGIPARGWRDILWRMWHGFDDEHVMLVAAGIAFYGLLALVPALAALVAIYGLAFDPAQVVTQVGAVAHVLPSEVSSLLQDQLVRLTTAPQEKLGIAAAIALAVALFSASSATKGLIEGLNIVYAEREKRSWFRLTAAAIALTVAGLVSVTIFLASTLLLPKLLAYIGVNQTILLSVISYVALALFLWLELCAIYRWAPNRSEAKFAWIAPGSLLAVVLLVLFSLAFSWFVRTFATYSAYGSLGVVIAFMTWFWISMVIVLVGAQLNAEAEHQTIRDSTTGLPMPMGLRGAVMADTVGKSEGAYFPAASAMASRVPSITAGQAAALAVSVGAIFLVWHRLSRERW